jgi:hypothetical protein
MPLSNRLNPYKLFSSLKRYNYNYVLYLIFVLAIFYLVMPRQYYQLYNSLLGKLFAVSVVVYLTSVNMAVGLVAAIVVMLSYDRLIEGMENKDSKKNDNGKTKLDIELKKSKEEHVIELKKINELKENKNNVQNIKKEIKKDDEMSNSVNEAIIRFKMDHCLNGKLVKNNMEEIKLSDLKSYFPQITFEDKMCNPCDPSCNFKMTSFDERITVEEKLRPKETSAVSVS